MNRFQRRFKTLFPKQKTSEEIRYEQDQKREKRKAGRRKRRELSRIRRKHRK